MFTPFPTLQQGCQTLQWSEALGLGLSSHPQLTLIWEMAGLYFEQRDVSHLGARTSPPLPKHHSPRVLSQRLFSSGLQKLPGPFKLLKTSEPPKSKSYFPFLPHRWLYIAPHTIANLGGLNPWTGLVYCLNTRPHAATSHSHPTGNCLQGGVHKESEGTSPATSSPTCPGAAASLLGTFGELT